MILKITTVFLLTDCLINKTGEDIDQYPQGGFDALKEFLSAGSSRRATSGRFYILKWGIFCDIL